MGAKEKLAEVRERARKRYAELLAARPGGDTWKPHQVKDLVNDEGDRIRLIYPLYLEGVQDEPYVTLKKCFIPVGDGTKNYPITSPAMFGMPDPVQEQADDLLSAGDKEAAKDYTYRDSYLCLIVVLEGEDADPKKVRLWEFGNSIFEQLLPIVGNKRYKALPWDNKDGLDLWIQRTGAGKNDTEYKVTPAVEPTPLENAEEIMKQAARIDLSAYVNVETEDTIRELLDGAVPDKEFKAEAKRRRQERDKKKGAPLGPWVTVTKRDESEEQEESESAEDGAGVDEEEEKAATEDAHNEAGTEAGEFRKGDTIRFEYDGKEATAEVVDLEENFPVVNYKGKELVVEEFTVLPKEAPKTRVRERAAKKPEPKEEKKEEARGGRAPSVASRLSSMQQKNRVAAARKKP